MIHTALQIHGLAVARGVAAFFAVASPVASTPAGLRSHARAVAPPPRTSDLFLGVWTEVSAYRLVIRHRVSQDSVAMLDEQSIAFHEPYEARSLMRWRRG